MLHIFETITLIAIGFILGIGFWDWWTSTEPIHSVPTWYKQEACITWISNPDEVDAQLKDFNDRHNTNAAALSDPINGIIWAHEPRTAIELQNLGHEVLHVFRGYFHPMGYLDHQ